MFITTIGMERASVYLRLRDKKSFNNEKMVRLDHQAKSQIMRLMSKGISQRCIAKKLKVDHTAVSRYIRCLSASSSRGRKSTQGRNPVLQQGTAGTKFKRVLKQNKRLGNRKFVAKVQKTCGEAMSVSVDEKCATEATDEEIEALISSFQDRF